MMVSGVKEAKNAAAGANPKNQVLIFPNEIADSYLFWSFHHRSDKIPVSAQTRKLSIKPRKRDHKRLKQETEPRPIDIHEKIKHPKKPGHEENAAPADNLKPGRDKLFLQGPKTKRFLEPVVIKMQPVEEGN
jgi:hypothetical protein